MALRSQYPAITVPDVSLPEFIIGRTRNAPPGHVALVDGQSEATLAYCDIERLVHFTAAALHHAGLRKGDVLAILSPNHVQYPIAFQATCFIGAIVTTLNPVYTAREIAHQLEDSKARFIVTVSAMLPKALQAAEAGAPLERIYLFDGSGPLGTAKIPVSAFGELALTGRRLPVPSTPIDPAKDVCAIPYSSGTSGLPKGVVLTHRNLVANLVQMAANHVQLSSNDVLVGVLPFFHIYAMVIILNLAMASAAKVVVMPGFEPNLFLKVLKHQGVTCCHVAPPIINFLAKSPLVDAILPLPRLKEIFSGAAPLGSEVATETIKRLGLRALRNAVEPKRPMRVECIQ